MFHILKTVASYLFIIFLGWFLKSRGLFRKEDAKKLGQIIVNVTLPAALIRNAGSIVIGTELPLLFSIAIVCSLITLSAGFLLAKRRRNPQTSAIMLCTSTYNIGAFLLPFVETFYPGAGVGYLCMFDTGNSIMGLGISYALAKAASSPDNRVTLSSMMKTLFSSVPFVTYLILYLLRFLNLNLPETVIDFASVIANANAFLTMFMIGLLIDFRLPASELKLIFKTISTRFLLNLVLMTLIFLIVPIDPFVRLITVLCIAAPVASASVVYSIECGYKGDLVGIVSTLSILISITEIIAIILIFGQSYVV